MAIIPTAIRPVWKNPQRIAGGAVNHKDIRITYMLNSGLKVEQWYSLYLTPDRMAGGHL